jgi:outer membrane protein
MKVIISFTLILMVSLVSWAQPAKAKKAAEVNTPAKSHAEVSTAPAKPFAGATPDLQNPMPGATLTLKTAVDMALTQNPNFLKARENIHYSEAGVPLIRSSLFPTVQATGTGYEKKDAAGNGNPLFGGDNYNQYVADIKLTQVLFQVGAISALGNAQKSLEISRLNSEISSRDLIGEVIKAYFQIVLNARNVETLMRQDRFVKESLNVAQSRERTGRGRLLDVLQVKTQVSLLQAQIFDAQNQLQIAAANLAYLIGDTGQKSFKITETLQAPDVAQVDTDVDLKHYQIPEILRDELAIEQLDDLKQMTLGKNLPNLALIGDYNYSNFKKEDLFNSYSNGWYVGLQLTIPIFSGFSSFYEQRQLTSQRLQLEFDKKYVESTVTYKQVTNRKLLETASNSINSGTEALKLAIATSDEAKRNYRYATIDFLQFLTVEKDYVQAEQDLNKQKFQYITALADYYSASGQDMSRLVSILESVNR